VKHVSDKSCRENPNTHLILSLFFGKIVPFLDDVGKYGRAREVSDDNTCIIRRLRLAYWVAKAADIHSEYVILLPFARQEWLH